MHLSPISLLQWWLHFVLGPDLCLLLQGCLWGWDLSFKGVVLLENIFIPHSCTSHTALHTADKVQLLDCIASLLHSGGGNHPPLSPLPSQPETVPSMCHASEAAAASRVVTAYDKTSESPR